MYESELIIAVRNGNGEIIAFQTFEEFMNGRKNIEILNCYTGQRLFDILFDDLGIIRYEDNVFALKIIFQMNPEKTTMSLLGKIAEAVIVRRCREDEEINKKWLSIARRKKAKSKTAERFQAVGTGLMRTKIDCTSIYNPADTQRDIVWVDDERMRAMIKSSYASGIEAGLQIKVSRNGMGYFFQDLCNLRYEVPVVYFDISHDYDKVARELVLNQRFCGKSSSTAIIEENFVRASAIDYNGYKEVCFYEDLVMALVAGKLTVEDLLKDKTVCESETFRNSLLSATISQIPLPNIIIK